MDGALRFGLRFAFLLRNAKNVPQDQGHLDRVLAHALLMVLEDTAESYMPLIPQTLKCRATCLQLVCPIPKCIVVLIISERSMFIQ